MQRQLAAISESLESAQSRLRSLSDRISEKDWSRKPGPEQWSAANCVEHLNHTSEAYLPLLRDALAEARELGGSARTLHYSRDALGWFMSMMIGPMRHIGKFRIGRVKTTSDFVPRGAKSRDQLLSDFVRLQAELLTIVRNAEGLPIDRVKVVSPFGGKMRYNAYSALVIVARHQHRHLDQAEAAAAG
jgi:hypothetical protein